MEVPPWAGSPQESIRRECERRGTDEVVRGCLSLLRDHGADPELIFALGGPPASWVFTGEAPGPDHWLRVWAARGLLWALDDAALPQLLVALQDDAWRVREMALKVVARHRLVAAAPAVALLRSDAHQRVAAAADRAHSRLARRPPDSAP